MSQDAAAAITTVKRPMFNFTIHIPVDTQTPVWQ